MNCLYNTTRLCPKVHMVTDFTVGTMKDHCLDCQTHELSTIHELFKLQSENWSAEQKIRLALEVWEDGNVNLLDLTEKQKAELIQVIRKKIPTFLQETK
ncbi:MAG: hypothetical protein ACTSRS_00295 [Candidatus Helarchaeota archaeon]